MVNGEWRKQFLFTIHHSPFTSRLFTLLRFRFERGLYRFFELGGDLVVVAGEVFDESALTVEDERLRDGRVAAEEGIDEQLVGVAELVLNVEAPDEVGHLGLILLAAD